MKDFISDLEIKEAAEKLRKEGKQNTPFNRQEVDKKIFERINNTTTKENKTKEYIKLSKIFNNSYKETHLKMVGLL